MIMMVFMIILLMRTFDFDATSCSDVGEDSDISW